MNLVELLYRSNNYISTNIPPGPKLIKIKKIINLQKGGTFLYVLGLMIYFNNYNKAAYTYLSLHGTYGMLWLLKDRIFPDRSWERKITIPSSIMSILLVLGPYWVSPFLIIKNKVKLSNFKMFITISLHTFGCVTMMASDTQKYFVLKERKKLINDGWFSKSRNINYLGEMMVYLSYALIGTSKIPYFILLYIWSILFYPNMKMKDKSILNKENGKKYIEHTNLLIPL